MRKILENILIIFQILFNKVILKKPDFSEKNIFLNGMILSNKNKEKNIITNLKEIEFSSFSQFGEDGIISWITSKIPDLNKVFIEIGTEDYWESNTRFLLKSMNWKGYLIEGSKNHIKKIKSQRIYWQNNIKAINEFVTKENINNIIQENIREKSIGLLSIDIDGNDLWVLKELNFISPDIVVCEYNTIFGDKYELTVPYDKNFSRIKKHHSNVYFGCSIKALISVMNKKNYFFLGTCSTGINAFFVKNDYKEIFDKIILNKVFFPSLVREARDERNNLTFNNIYDNLDKIKHMDIIELNQNKKKLISDFGELYSNDWKKIINEG